MFIVCGKTDKSVSVKFHLTTNYDVAKEVAKDLEKRFGEMEIDNINSDEVIWDPGGIMTIEDPTYSFDLGPVVFKCKRQHFDLFCDKLKSSSIRGDKTKYVKLHSWHNCICLSDKEVSTIKKCIAQTMKQKI